MRTRFLISLLLSIAASVQAAPRVIASINDPVGDDNGSGSLILPQRSDFEAGDLDLVRLQISRDGDGYWFEATFKNPIRDPANAFGTIGSEPLSNVARKGFYQFNLDVYIDTDRLASSGNVFTLPGRKVSIDPAFAWERAVILTPRPEAMRSQLLGALEQQFPDRPKGEAAASIDQSIVFPTRVRVRNRSVLFFVPAAFLGDGDASKWAVTAIVTGANNDIPIGLSLLPGSKTPPEQLNLGVLQPAVGRPRDTFGYAGGPTPSVVVDLLAPAPDLQARVLSSNPGTLVGVPLSASVENQPTESPPPKEAVPAPPTMVQELLLPNPAPKPAAAPGAPGSERPSIAKRLEVLQDLFDKKLIGEAEYRQQRQRILNEL